MQGSILLISQDERVTRGVRWKLEDNGFLVRISPSLEESFLSNSGSEMIAVVLDLESVDPENYWQAGQQLQWFRRRCPVLLLSDEGTGGPLEESCDEAISRTLGQEHLLDRIRSMQS